MSDPRKDPQPQVAVWLLVGATFVFSTPALLFPDAPWGVRIALFAVGLVVIVAGLVQLRREMRARRGR